MSEAGTDIVIDVQDLKVHFGRARSNPFAAVSKVHAVDGISFQVRRGTTFGLVGESGSGKTTTALAMMRLAPVTAGHVWLEGTDMAVLEGEALRAARRHVQIIFQDPYASLNPRWRVRDIIGEPLKNFGICKNNAEVTREVEKLLSQVGLNPADAKKFPHEFSGGQRQRIGIARALALEPAIIIADEAVSALDVSIQAQVLDLLAELKMRLHLSMLFITHDLRVAARICDRIIVMQKGQIVEAGPVSKVLHDPDTAYTRSLLEAIPGQDYERSLAAADEG